MNTYKVTEEWTDFEKFILDKLKDVDKEAVGFMYRDNEIIIRSYDDTILTIIRQHYKLIPCEQPSNVFDGDDGWAYMGNHRLFDLTKL
jgi:hypothetical protein